MKFGIVYHWRDPFEIVQMADDFLELRIFEEDLKNKYRPWKSKLKELRKDWDYEISIHMPEYFEHPNTGLNTLVDLASTERKIYNFSLEVIKTLIEFGKSIEASKIIIHPGGISEQPALGDTTKKMDRLKKSLSEISGMEFAGDILLENMPWFYWRRDGTRWFSTICYTPQDFRPLLKYCDGMVLDFSHGYLSDSSGSNRYLEEYTELYKDQIQYVHIADSLPPDNEGLQIGEGNINFEGILNKLDKTQLWLVPEVWKGHENFGEGFEIALDRINHLI
ncbi:MAG: sugar phosphate isomerase/epimerase [Thermoplasmata archaeon]|nr:MAG: sugar phosphate isomerase/epimerase [Thermoplasmata archaeon]